MKLWDKGIPYDKVVENFTTLSDRRMDLILAPYDIAGSIAHVIMLESVNLISEDEKKALIKTLVKINDKIISGTFNISEGVEDVHSEVEKRLTEMLGDTGKKIHIGRSRNDQVLLDIHLYIRDKIRETVMSIKEFTEKLLDLSERYRDYIIPGYTHFQAAMPSSFGLWFGSFAETLADDLLILHGAYRIVDQNPLGSAAGFGTSIPIDRQITTKLLGFKELRYNSMYAMNSRGKTELISSQALACLALTIGKYAGDICLYMSGNFGFLDIPEKYTSGSSIMPHKRNPDVFELVRARCSGIQALPGEISLIVNNLQSGYHRDYQMIKEHFLPSFDHIISCIEMMSYIFPNLIIKKVDLTDEKYRYIFSVENVNKLVIEGKPFREAYQQVAEEIRKGHFTPLRETNYTHEGSIGNLCNDKIAEKIQIRIKQFEFEKNEKALQRLLISE